MPRHLALFLGGLASIFVAIASPLDPFGYFLLTVHMVQHLLLMFAAPAALMDLNVRALGPSPGRLMRMATVKEGAVPKMPVDMEAERAPAQAPSVVLTATRAATPPLSVLEM